MRRRWPAVRRALLVTAGFGSLDYAAYLVHPGAGFAAAGVTLLWLDWLTGDRDDDSKHSGPGGHDG